MENTETTFKDMPITSEVDRAGMLEIYRKMLLIDLFQTKIWQMGFESAFAHQSPHSSQASHTLDCHCGWNLFCHYQLGQDNKLDGQNQPESLGESAELSHSEPSHHFANDRSTGFLVLNYEKPDCLSVFSTILKLGGRQMKNPYL